MDTGGWLSFAGLVNRQLRVPAAPAPVSGEAAACTRRGAAMTGICLGFLMITLDATIVNVALPAIRADVGGALAGLQWIVNAYTIAFAALLLTVGALADQVGARRMFLAGLGVFVLASAGRALASSAPVLIAARGVQGLGAAALLSGTDRASVPRAGRTCPGAGHVGRYQRNRIGRWARDGRRRGRSGGLAPHLPGQRARRSAGWLADAHRGGRDPATAAIRAGPARSAAGRSSR